MFRNLQHRIKSHRSLESTGLNGKNSVKSIVEKLYDEWEITYENLRICNDEKLGTGAFAVVYKAKLKNWKSPLLKQLERKLGLNPDAVGRNVVAVKMLRNNLNENDR